MQREAIHQNLSTSFVDVPALVRYLRDLQFVGTVRIELISYEAEIRFSPSREIMAREFDHLSGRITIGHKAFWQILKRSSEPHGRVSVVPGCPDGELSEVFIDPAISQTARACISGHLDGPVYHLLKPRSEITLAGEWGIVVDLVCELLNSVDRVLVESNLNFGEAFRSACSELGAIYPFLDPATHTFRFAGGRLVVTRFIEPESLVEAVCEVLSVVIERLKRAPQFDAAHKSVEECIAQLSKRRRTEHQKYFLSAHLRRIFCW